MRLLGLRRLAWIIRCQFTHPPHPPFPTRPKHRYQHGAD